MKRKIHIWADAKIVIMEHEGDDERDSRGFVCINNIS